MTVRVVSMVAAVCLAVAPQGQQPPSFRSVTRVIPVTVTVVDQQGRPINDLQAGEFKVFENGRERPIVNFFPQLLAPTTVIEPDVALSGSRQAGLAPATRRTFLLVLGFGRIQHPTDALDGAMNFVREHLLPQDAVGVMALHRATKFTTDHRAIEEVLARYKKAHERMVGDILAFFRTTRAPFVCGGPPIPEQMLAAFDHELFDGALPRTSLRSSLDLLLGMDQAPATGEKRWQVQLTFDRLQRDLAHACTNLSDAMVTSGRLKLIAAIEALRHVEGEKHVVFMGPAMAPPRGRELLAARANDARVVVDFISTAGTAIRGLSGCLPCRDVAESTGGHYTSVDMMDKALARVDQNSRTSYLLGYTPADTALDGTYRAIRVQVTRPKAVASYRHGYFASEEPAPFAANDLLEAARTDAAGRYGVDAGDIPVIAAVDSLQPPTMASGPVSLSVTVSIDMSAITLRPADGLFTGGLDVSIYCGDAKEKVIGQTQVRWNLRPSPDTREEWTRNGFTRSLTVTATAKPKYVKVVVYDRESDRVGSATVTIK